MKYLKLTDDMAYALALIERTTAAFKPGVDALSFLELPKIALADATVAAVKAAEARQRRHRVAKLPESASRMVGVVELEARPKRRRA